MRPPSLRLSVVIPTFQRRDLVVENVGALAHQEFRGNFEVIVVVDGSTDGSVEALRSLKTPFPLSVIEQHNLGASRARNRGASHASGEILLFLDDDMEAHRNLLAVHDRYHREGADVVLGAIPLHPGSPRSLLTTGIAVWTDERARRLAEAAADIPFDDIITGQMSIDRELFTAMGGFDESFTRRGAYGAEDVEFGQRLLNDGRRVVFAPEAISYQRYVVDAATHLRQVRQVGHADVSLVRKHPELLRKTFEGKRHESEIHRVVWRPMLAAPRLLGPLRRLLSRLAIAVVDSGRIGRLTAWLFFTARAAEYWQGVVEAGGIPKAQPVRVLNYHAIADLGGDPVLHEYGVPPDQFALQLDALTRGGYHFLEPDEFLRFLDGKAGVPKRAVLLTFDDCYRDLVEAAVPLLEERAIPAIAFAVSSQLGGTNTWDQAIGARALPLLDVPQLAMIRRTGIEIGAHSHTHRPLDQVPAEQLDSEIAGSVRQLNDAGLGPVRFYAYPHGVHGEAVRDAASKAGIQAAFTIDAGTVRPGADRLALRRVEILRGDQGRRFLKEVATAGWRPAPAARARHQLRRLFGASKRPQRPR